jgi:hypothetical protein
VSIFERAQFHLTELVAAAAKVQVNPSEDGLPGLGALQKLINGAAKYAILACVATFLIGAAQWGFGSRANNYSQASDGRERMLKSIGGAFGIGAVAAIINFFYNAGTGVS